MKLRCSTLRRKIDSWITIQHLYIPALRLARTLDNNAQQNRSEVDVSCIPLHLLSSLVPSISCDSRLLIIEWKLRSAQASDALDDLCEALCIRAYLLIDKQRFQRGQIANTCSNNTIARSQTKVQSAAARYRAARLTFCALSRRLHVDDEWKTKLPELKDQDICGMAAEEDDLISAKKKRRKLPGGKDKVIASEGYNKLSWIWTHSGAGEQADGDALLSDGTLLAMLILYCTKFQL